MLSIAAFVGSRLYRRPPAAAPSATGDRRRAPRRRASRDCDAWNEAQQIARRAASWCADPRRRLRHRRCSSGVPIVARELERGTTRLAWSLAPSRWRWFVARVLPVLACSSSLAFVAGVAVDRSSRRDAQDEDLAESFTPVRRSRRSAGRTGRFLFGVAVVVGAVIGRALPAVIVTAADRDDRARRRRRGPPERHPSGTRRSPVASGPTTTDRATRRPLPSTQSFVLPDGSLVGYEYFGDSEVRSTRTGCPSTRCCRCSCPGQRSTGSSRRARRSRWPVATLVALLLAGVVVARRRPG